MSFKERSRIFEYKDIDFIIKVALSKERKVRKKEVLYYNVPCAFDIETTSFFQLNGEKQAIMYEWTLGINGYVIIGRTWEEFIYCYRHLSDNLGLHTENRLIIYVHNLSFEFQFLRKRIEWENVFSLDSHKPIYALSVDGIEFRCSYLLSGYGLAKLSEQLNKYKVEKMVGDLDYSLYRHSKTPLTEKELKYCENDVRVVMAYIQECIENDGNISKIPLTKTGYVRNYCRNYCLYGGDRKNANAQKIYKSYRNLIKNLTLDEKEYLQLKRVFMGGFTHANHNHVKKIINNVDSFDFTSSYPAVMCSEKFPMSKSTEVNITSREQFDDLLKNYCCIFDVHLIGLSETLSYEHPLSVSKCRNIKNQIEDNGRIVEADYLETTVTEVDWKIYSKFYKFDKAEIYNFRYYKKEYLPTNFVKSILDLYKTKTELKNVEGKEVEYMKSKEQVNSAYGMIVTDICRDEIIYDNMVKEWREQIPDISEMIDKYNNSLKRFLFYPWGIWVTAYARRNLFMGILEFGNDYIYSDTDSIKVLNKNNHIDFINSYNEYISSKLKTACAYHKIDFNATRPKTIKGKEKPLGVWDEELGYNRFKTLGAKRYMVEQDNKISITVAGLNKKVAVPYLENKYKTNDNIFKAFDENLYIPANHTGKNTHTYIEYEQKGIIKDYFGVNNEYDELSSIHLESADYSLSMTIKFIDYLLGYREKLE